MTETAEAIVVGAGVVGASIAFHLTRLGLRDVRVLERGQAAGQASGQSGALVRTHYSNPHEARLANAALPWFEEWAERIGGDCGFTRTGFLQFTAPADAAKLRANTATLREAGVDTCIIEQDEIAALQPGVALHEGEIAAYEPRSGYADPVKTTCSLLDAAQRSGATLSEGRQVTALRVVGRRISGVETSDGPVDAPIVILANGAWSVELARPLGLDLPIEPILVQIVLFQRPAALGSGAAGHLTIIDRNFGFYARPDGSDLTLVGMSGLSRRLEDLEVGVNSYEPEIAPRVRERVAGRLPALAGAAAVRGRSGPLDVTPDRGAIIGAAPDVEGLYLAVGMSGSGFKKAPAIGACLAELITAGAATTAPIAPFRPDRFAVGDLIVGNDYQLPEDGGRALVH